MTRQPGEHRIASAAFTQMAQPADPVLGRLLQVLSSGEILAAIRSGTIGAAALDVGSEATLAQRLARWRARLASIAPDAGIDAASQKGICLVCPGDPGWPRRLDDLGPGRPYALWVHGDTDLQACCATSVSVTGSRAATAYGQHVATSIAAGLAGLEWTVVSGGDHGIDTCAHQGALAVGGCAVAVLAGGPDVPYPLANRGLFAAVASQGAVISERPPGTLPDRQQFLLRNRIIAALSCGTVVVEAAERSGTMATARRAITLGRTLMAVPGPVTSATSAGCHALLREGQAACVTGAEDITACLRLA